MGQPQKLPLWQNRRRSQNSPILARPNKDLWWKLSSRRNKLARRSYTLILGFIFAIVLFAIASQVIFLLGADEETLVSMPDMRLHTWLGFGRMYGYYDGIRSLVPEFNLLPPNYLNESAVARLQDINRRS